MFKYSAVPFSPDIMKLTQWLNQVYQRLSGGSLVKEIVFDIGDWDMQSNTTKQVDWKQSLGDLSFKSVTSVHVQVFKDDMTESYGGDIKWKIDNSTTKITLTRPSFYNSTDFNSTSSTDSTFKTRGKVTICLVR